MKSWPFELIVALVFGALLLLNFAMQRVARRLRDRAQGQPPVQPADDEPPEVLWGRAPAGALEAPMPVVPRPARQASAAPRRRTRRYSRDALFADRRSLQDAFVIAAILGRCRADEPHELR